MSGTIRPVTSRIPSSWKVWDQTQLPLAVTVQPLWTPPRESPPASSKQQGLVGAGAEGGEDENCDHILYSPAPLQQIPKCQHCGAPHPDTDSHTPLGGSGSDGGGRHYRSGIKTEAVGIPSSSTSSSNSNSKHYHQKHYTSTSITFLCYLCHQISTSTTTMSVSNHLHDSPSPPRQGGTKSVSDGRSGNGTAATDDTARKSKDLVHDAWTFALPLRLQHHSPSKGNSDTSNNNNTEPVYRVPAIACPLLWYIILDGQTSESWYWTHVSQTLQETLVLVPSHVHVAILIHYGNEQFGLFATDSPVPHLRRFPAGSELATLLVQAALPAQFYRDHLLAIARNCSQVPTLSSSTSNSSGETNDEIYAPNQPSSSSIPMRQKSSWKWLVEQLATGLVQVGQPAGQRKVAPPPVDLGLGTYLPYAGAFCTCFRASRSEKVPETSDTLSPTKLAGLCAQAVLTVQTVFVVDPTTYAEPWSDPVYDNRPVLSFVEAASLGWCAHSDNDITTTHGWATWRATWPWRPSFVFGGSVRMRTSPGLIVSTDDDDDEDDDEDDENDDFDEDGLRVDGNNSKNKCVYRARFLPKQGGLTGPAVAAKESSCLWTLPSLDSHTTLTIDLSIEENIAPPPSDAPHPKAGMMQVCIAYTTLEADEDGKVWTVRRIKVANRSLQRTATVESLYRRVDPEALAVVLLHKLVRMASRQRQSIGEEWLEAFLVAVYESAVEEEERQEDLRRHGVADEESYFIASERLLGVTGAESTTRDILLAQGHGRLRPIPLLLFLLMQQCQMQERSSSTNQDGNGLSVCDLVRMCPDTLTRCLAPRLQLWTRDEVLVDLIDLKQQTVVNTIREEIALLKNPTDKLLLILDAPDQIVVANALAFLPGNPEHTQNLPKYLGPNLQSTLIDMASSYPTPPPIIYGGSSSLLGEVCREDLPLGDSANFEAWRTTVSQAVHKELLRKKILDHKNAAHVLEV